MTGSSGLRQEVLQVLNQLRGRIRRYVFLEGLALVLCTVGLAFWISLGLDYGFELPPGARRGLLVVAGSATLAAATWYIVLRVIRGFQNRSLALVLERRFPELNERLITAVDLTEGVLPGPPLTETMLHQTAQQATQLLQRLRLGEVFNSWPLLRSVGGATLLVASIAGFGWSFEETFQTWYRRNLLFADDYYHRDTHLRVYVLADPGERPVEFLAGVYKHPRGSDLVLVAEVVEGSEVPREVHYRYRSLETSGAGDGYMTRVGDRTFRQKLAGLKDSVRVNIRAGDFRTRQPLLVEVVEPPQIDQVTLDCLYPDYTGLNDSEERSEREEPQGPASRSRVDVLGAQVSLPAGTDLILEARLNKPLVEARVQTDRFELLLSRELALLTPISAGGEWGTAVALSLVEPVLSEDGRTLRIPFVLSPLAEPATPGMGAGWPLTLPADAALRFWLHDADNVLSAEPTRLNLNAIPDQPPQVDVRLKGIGSSITRQATIPLAGQIRDAEEGSQVYGVVDDYGVIETQFEFRVEGGPAAPSEQFRTRPFAVPAGGRREVLVAERFSVLELDVAVGQKLLLKATARDGDVLTGPHTASSSTYSFQIVSDDELIALVAVKELNIRRRFEQILEEVRNTRKDLLLHRKRLEAAAGLRAKLQARPAADEAKALAEQLAELETGALTAVERATSGVRKNHNETQSIEEEFRDVRDELANNAIPDVRPMLERIENGIVQPLHGVNEVDFNDCDDLLVKLRESLEESADAVGSFELAADRLGETLVKLEAVLAQMLKNEDYSKVLEMLRSVIRAQDDLKRQTEVERKKKLIEGLK